MKTVDLAVGEDYEISLAEPGERAIGTMCGTFVGMSEDASHPLAFRVGNGSLRMRSARMVFRPWAERIAEQQEREAAQRESIERADALFEATYGNLPERAVEALASIDINAATGSTWAGGEMGCVLWTEGEVRAVMALYLKLIREDVGMLKRLPLADKLAEPIVLRAAGVPLGDRANDIVDAQGNFSPVDLALVVRCAKEIGCGGS